jgi:hypothetical protein
VLVCESTFLRDYLGFVLNVVEPECQATWIPLAIGNPTGAAERGQEIPKLCGITDELDAARRKAGAFRLKANRSISCDRCRVGSATEAPSQAVALAEQKAA